MARDVRQHGIRRTKFGIFSSGRRLMARDRSGGAETKLPWRVTSGSTASGEQGLLPLLGEKASRDATTSQGKEGRAQAPPDEKTCMEGWLPCTFRGRWGFRRGGPGLTRPKPDAAGAGRRPGAMRQTGSPRQVSCAGRGPGSGCAAARGRGPGAECRRHSSGRGSAAGCAGRRLRQP